VGLLSRRRARPCGHHSSHPGAAGKVVERRRLARFAPADSCFRYPSSSVRRFGRANRRASPRGADKLPHPTKKPAEIRFWNRPTVITLVQRCLATHRGCHAQTITPTAQDHGSGHA
jgi:hypothetical protein